MNAEKKEYVQCVRDGIWIWACPKVGDTPKWQFR